MKKGPAKNEKVQIGKVPLLYDLDPNQDVWLLF